MPTVKERKAPRAKVKKVDREVLKQLLFEHVAPYIVEHANKYGWNDGSFFNEVRRRYESIHITQDVVSITSMKVKKTGPYKYDLLVTYGDHGRTVRLLIRHDGRITR